METTGGLGEGKNPIEEFVHWIFLCACSTDDPSFVRAILRDASQYFTLEKSASESFCSISALSEAVSFKSSKIASLNDAIST